MQIQIRIQAGHMGLNSKKGKKWCEELEILLGVLKFSSIFWSNQFIFFLTKRYNFGRWKPGPGIWSLLRKSMDSYPDSVRIQCIRIQAPQKEPSIS